MDAGERPLVDGLPYRTVDVAVLGGTLRAGIWGERGPVVLCSHGVTGSHMQFQHLAAQLAREARLVAPDHRGRGRSNTITGPWGMAAHAADMVALLDHLEVERADLLLGHSMGGFVAAVTAAQYPQRVSQVLMVDGGVPLMNVGFITRLPFSNYIIEKIAQKILGPSLARLEMTFESREAHYQFWRAHPALADDWSPEIERYLDYDLTGEAPALRSSVRKDALLLDVRTQLIEDLVERSLEAIRCPVRFLRAPRGVMNDKALYDERKLARAARGIARYSSATIEGVNHFTIGMSERGAKAVADEVRKILRAGAAPL
jgi:pimeloyl-ACP methyl ester carboxylesterase